MQVSASATSIYLYNFEPKNKWFTFNHCLCTPVTHNVNISEGDCGLSHVCNVIREQRSKTLLMLCWKSHTSELMAYSNCCCHFAFSCVEADITADNEKFIMYDLPRNVRSKVPLWPSHRISAIMVVLPWQQCCALWFSVDLCGCVTAIQRLVCLTYHTRPVSWWKVQYKSFSFFTQ